jgi:hypothetical protein
MADDEVLSLVEMGYFHVDAYEFPFPADLLPKLPRALPVWHAIQRRALAVLPQTPAGFRIPSLVCGVLASAFVFFAAARSRSLWFAVAVAIVMNTSLLFVQIAQIDRFYSMPLLLLLVTYGLIWMPAGGMTAVALVAGLSVLTVLSNNVTVAAFGLSFASAMALAVVGRVPRRVFARSGAAFVASTLVYLGYLLPIIRGWSTTGNPTPVLVSFAAYAGVPALALALLGCWFLISEQRRAEPSWWWMLSFAGSLCLLQISTFSWNPRYFVFFLPPLWILAAEGLYGVAERIGRRFGASVWYGCVVLVLLPALLSHYSDGSRHDYQQAAHVLIAQVHPGQTILSDDAETISYYLPGVLRETLKPRTKTPVLPATEFFMVVRANAWSTAPMVPNRRVDLLAEIFKRRYDAFSHIVRVYRVYAAE